MRWLCVQHRCRKISAVFSNSYLGGCDGTRRLRSRYRNGAGIAADVICLGGVWMAEVVLFHHAQGLTPGVAAFADELRRAGHTVHTPDLYDGRTFATLEEGLAYAEEIGFDEVTERGVQAAEALPAELVYAGFSLGLGA